MGVDRDEELHVDEVDASSGSKQGIVRYILLFSLLLVVAAMSIIWITGSLSASQGSHAGAVTNQAPPAPATGG